MAKGLENELNEVSKNKTKQKKNSLSCAWPDQLDSDLYLQSPRAGDQLSRRAHLAADTSCGGLLDRNSYEKTAWLTPPME